MAAKNKLLLIDGSMLLFQMFFGMPARIPGRDGRPIHGTLGFVGALIKMIKLTEPTHVAALFDGEHPHLRAELDAGYKANRPGFADTPDKDNPFSQLPDIYASLDCMGIARAEIMDVEADDVIAAYALAYGGDALDTPRRERRALQHADRGMEIVIASHDSDFFQLINANVSVLRYRGDKTVICGTQYVRQKYNVAPGLYADYKSLTGDASDNIKGAPHIGPKTAAALINQFGGLRAAIGRAEEIAKPSVREAVRQNTARLETNYKLIKLDGTAEMPYRLDDLRYTYNGVTTSQVLKSIGVK
ncbi:MAG: flap endonuclease [Defluviitaleaceae bacterium]|nr:flap endonuclease [Defluviitaleaceae bacterium]